jgi:hypothetical protein
MHDDGGRRKTMMASMPHSLVPNYRHEWTYGFHAAFLGPELPSRMDVIASDVFDTVSQKLMNQGPHL